MDFHILEYKTENGQQKLYCVTEKIISNLLEEHIPLSIFVFKKLQKIYPQYPCHFARITNKNFSVNEESLFRIDLPHTTESIIRVEKIIFKDYY